MNDNKLLKEIIDYNKHRYYNFTQGIVEEKVLKYERILKSRYNKVSRIRKHLVYMITHRKNIYFLTFTEDDKMLKLCERAKRDRIKDVLNSFNDSLYILNIDYGKKTEREHYHCIFATNSDIDVRQFIKVHYPCRSGCKKIDVSSDDIKRLSKYVNKLSNHTSKDSTYNRRVVYNFKGYDSYKNLGRIMFIKDSYKLGLL